MTLNDIRQRSGLLIVVIGVAMLGFILTDLMSSGTSLFQQGQNLLLKVDRKEIAFTNFEKELEENINIKFASNFGTVNITDAQRSTERDLLWEQKMNEILFSEKFSQSGVDVGKTESWDLISGEINNGQAPLFGYFFREQTESGGWNQYTPDLIREWIEMGADNPQWSRYIHFKNNIIRERGFSKYYNAIKKGLYATKNDGESYYYSQTKSVSGKYIYIACDNPSEEDFPSDKEIRQYYKNNKLEFPNIPNREISYFIFDLAPSSDDKKSILDEMNELILDRNIFNKRLNKDEVELGFSNTNNVENFVNQYGDNKYSLTLISRDDFSKIEETKDISDNIIKPFFENQVCKMGRVLESKKDSVTIVYLERGLYASDQTLNEIYSTVVDFINENEKIDNLEEVSQKINNKPRVVTLEKMDQSVPGLGVSRQIVRWAFNQETMLNEPNFFDLQDKYIVAIVSKIAENETSSILDVYEEIKLILAKQNIGEKLIKRITDTDYMTIEDLAKKLKISIKTVDQLRMNSDVFGNEGYNPGAVGAFFGLPINTISAPFFSKNGVFVFNKLNESKINYPSNFSRYQQLIEKTNSSETDLLLVDILKNNKKIVDNRFNFY